jgi:hypothetical protein
MHFQFDMSSLVYPQVEAKVTAADTQGLLQQLLDVQKEQLGCLRAVANAHDGTARWKAFVARWQNDFPGIAESCREILPILERTYGKLITELTENLSQNGGDALDNDFSLQDFLDRYGMRLSQLGTILNLVGPFAEAGSPSGSA